MQRVIINKGKVGLVFRRGNYTQVLTEGIYWLKSSNKIFIFDMVLPFIPPIELSILLGDAKLKDLLTIVEVKDNEIALQYEFNNLKTVLKPGRHAFWNGVIDYTFIKADTSKIEINEDISRETIQRAALYPYIRTIKVEPYQKALFYIDGKLDKVLGTGMYYFWKNSIDIQVARADVRQQQLEISGQEILTKDKASLRLNFFAQYKVVDIVKAMNDNKEYEKQLYILIQLALREFVGILTLDEILEKKESVSEYVANFLYNKADKLGVEIAGCGVRDIILPGDVKEIMNQVLVAQKQAQANIIMRREETASTRSLLNTAKIMEENEMLFKLKEMEYVEKIADKINSISLSGGNQILEQMKEIFTPKKS